MVWDSHLFQSFPQFIVIHTVKGFVIVNQAEIDVFLVSCLLKLSSSFSSGPGMALSYLSVLRVLPVLGPNKRHDRLQGLRQDSRERLSH